MKRTTSRTKSPRSATPAKSRKPAKPRLAAAPSAAAGDADVRAYLKKLPDWQRAIAQRFDDLLVREVADLRRCIKWGMPFYGVEGRGWIVSCGGFAKCVKVTFFQGVRLKPVPPVGASKQTRSLDVTTPAELDAAPVASWVRQALKLPGFAS